MISLRSVTFHHDYLDDILTDVNLDISPGERLAILGPNGSGKSTLLRLLAGQWRPTSGTVLIDDQPISYNRRGRDHVRRRVQLVLQEPDDQLFATSVRADVSYGPVNLGLEALEVQRRVDKALASCGITELAERVPHQLSYGQRKQVALAGALAMQPEFLLLDEPTAGLDPQATRTLLTLLETVRGEGTTVVLTSHDVDFAYAFADRVAIVSDKKLTTGRKSEILTDRALVESSGLVLPWAPAASQLAGEEVGSSERLWEFVVEKQHEA
ncbi:energy-coupling factor ABC transporter ATP-binding protein [Corynebacterium epidermidicanis]|uniref:ABC transporter ATP-binding protein n=1 Tax=Corynebacterium epidermidicanis TaxID=1050174 RepID=A0A0G3GTN1_9CORY|nr:ABC transporter ATP-binding protein [Corynebacterium epidermidicanis]AKK02913.1 cobalt transport protein ATP-binding subunit [Corynebacterium epidermidicanis]